jgi:hypothetical protein
VTSVRVGNETILCCAYTPNPLAFHETPYHLVASDLQALAFGHLHQLALAVNGVILLRGRLELGTQLNVSLCSVRRRTALSVVGGGEFHLALATDVLL